MLSTLEQEILSSLSNFSPSIFKLLSWVTPPLSDSTEDTALAERFKEAPRPELRLYFFRMEEVDTLLQAASMRDRVSDISLFLALLMTG